MRLNKDLASRGRTEKIVQEYTEPGTEFLYLELRLERTFAKHRFLAYTTRFEVDPLNHQATTIF